MGWFGSPSVEESKTVDATGAINNNMVVKGDSVEVFSMELVILVGILVVLRILEFGYFIYRCKQRSLKKKYTTANGNRA